MRLPALPPGADLVRDPPDWLAVDSRPLPRPMTAYAAWQALLARPLPGLGLAMRLRDAVAARFRLERLNSDLDPAKGRWPADPKIGDRLDFFTIERVTPEVLTLAARDRHLDTITCITTTDGRLGVTSSVVWHNALGRAYMLPVGLSHRLIVRLMLARLR